MKKRAHELKASKFREEQPHVLKKQEGNSECFEYEYEYILNMLTVRCN